MSKNIALQLNPISCQAHGLCAHELPELIRLDEWGYPVLNSGPIPPEFVKRAKSAANSCPVLALRLVATRPPAA